MREDHDRHSPEHPLPNLHVSRHPLVKHKITLLSDDATPTALFRELVRELTHLLLYEATADLPLRDIDFTSPMETATGKHLDATISLVPILRAGLGMVDGARELMPGVPVYHLGIYRDERTYRPVSYYHKLPAALDADLLILLDPMLATAGSASAAVDELKGHGARWIKYVGLIAAPEGAQRMLEEHSDVPIHVARLDRELNAAKFIQPGLGDAGDRLFGTNQ